MKEITQSNVYLLGTDPQTLQTISPVFAIMNCHFTSILKISMSLFKWAVLKEGGDYEWARVCMHTQQTTLCL